MTNRRDRILIVEDDPVARVMFSTFFASMAFDVCEATRGDECWTMLECNAPDMLLLDINLPDCDGVALAQQIRVVSDVCIIFVTSRSSDVDRILGLEMAGDDYVTKPVLLRELLARVRAVLRCRRSGWRKDPDSALGFGDWIIDLTRRELMRRDGQQIRLTRGEFDLLAALVEARGRPLSRDYLCEVISNREESPSQRTVDALVVRLRRKLVGSTSTPVIATVHGIGYKFDLDVSRR